jgi:8-oxo-dGTP pyrophosphatase MutT (NUDIX family)
VDRISFASLDAMLAAHPSSDEKEARDVAFVRAFLTAHPRDAHLRKHRAGHLTGSGFVLDALGERVLLLHHGKLGRWLQPGGHGEGETDPRLIALREIREETSLTAQDMVAFPDARVLDVDVHCIPARPGEPEHRHLDLRYGFRARGGVEPRLSSESRALRWFALDDLPKDVDASLRRAVAKLRRAI